MITILTGSNQFLLQQRLRQLIADFVIQQGDMAVERFDCEETDFLVVKASLDSMPFLSPKKLVVLRAPSTQKEFMQGVEQLLAELPQTHDLIIYEPKIDKRTAYYKFLKKQPGFEEYNELDENGLVGWLASEAKARQATISPSDARYLIERVGADQVLLNNELEKLIAYQPAITRQTIELLCEPSPKSTIFDLLDAAFAGENKRVLRLYDEQRRLKVEPQQIIAMLAWQLHILATVLAAGNKPDAEIARLARLNPYVVGKSRRLAKGMSLVRARELVRKLLQLDTKSKTSSVDTDDALQAYLLSL